MKAGVKTAVGASARIEEWRRAGDALRAELAATRDRLALELEEAENALDELDGRPAVPEKHQRRAETPPPTPKVKPVGKGGGERSMRPRGTGCAFPSGKGWKWKIGGGGKYRRSEETFPSKEVALAALDASLAGHPAPKAVLAADTKTEPKAETSNSPWHSLGAGWGPADENGLAKHLSCSGRGTVGGNRCAGCEGQGYGRAKLRRSAA